ncbi:hypothetical protein N7499_007761 [Penicillium canescens]|uniref:DUF1993 domain-containing protein n=1 Tax=Penicillium canescens TaxID=5083 RepID=A0AAD6HY38_PENCN|nr:uncharacterized protein N7446_012798 [Penicillium canescens]KAJ6022446.1 hypothetical protein N7460_012841 [Penicillium canescens]KAJ6026295.1 hypothetical protein N7444_013974 [Penicillium canescens]KAJ6041732.1 hypothetical protein N7446_012798 [Penicillium canescens]KAJ6075780.1 hypothetical protein N7499_007761 [Penicillium canescens]KAJ6158092.1 hypothetical protein N7485_010918 [Penicillium canescens]
MDLPSYSIYDGTFHPAKVALISLNHLLMKAEEHFNVATLLTAKLYADSKPFKFHVHQVIQKAEEMLAKLTHRPSTIFDPMQSFIEMHSTSAQVLRGLNAANRSVVTERGEDIELGIWENGLTVSNRVEFANGVSLPNIFYHLTIVFEILCKEGVPLDEEDFNDGFLFLHHHE